MIFQGVLWQITVTPPWRAVDTEHCVEITQPEGAGALHISGARKTVGLALDEDPFSGLKGEIPLDTEVRSVRLGDFKGYCAEYID